MVYGRFDFRMGVRLNVQDFAPSDSDVPGRRVAFGTDEGERVAKFAHLPLFGARACVRSTASQSC
jgi:hypothetical protein